MAPWILQSGVFLFDACLVSSTVAFFEVFGFIQLIFFSERVHFLTSGKWISSIPHSQPPYLLYYFPVTVYHLSAAHERFVLLYLKTFA